MAEGKGPNNPQQPDQDPKRPGAPGPKLSRNVASWLFLLALALLLVMVLSNSMAPTQEISISEFESLVANKQITELTIKDEDGVLEGARKPAQGDAPNTPNLFTVNFPRNAIDSEFIQRLHRELPETDIKSSRRSQFLLVLLGTLPYILIFGLIWFFIIRQLRGAGGAGGMLGNFGRSRHRVTQKEQTNITFADVAGIEEAKEEVQELIEFLKAPKKFQRLGARIPRGVLLVGAPGCGKTLLARAIAGEAEVPFFSISGSDFVEMFVGVGASRVRDLFKQAKENSPCIIFLDEVDAIGRRRGANFAGGGHDEREQTLNAILVEMDGFDTSTQVIVIAATNRADVLDPALIRPGRFDQQVYVPLPDLQGRYEILKVHINKVKLGPTVDVKRLARGTPMFSGAELAALVNEAAIIATMYNKEYVEQEDLEEARDKVRWGRAKKSAAIDEHDRKLTAYHEAGHALIQALEKDADPVHKVSIIPRGPAGGATFSLPERDRLVYTKKYLLAMLRVMFGGRLAEEMFFDEISSGASSDIKQASEMARHMVREWGMGERAGFVYYGDDTGRSGWEFGGREYSDKTAELIDEEVKSIIDSAYEAARNTLLTHRDKVEDIAKALLKFETVTGEELNAVIRGESIERAGVADLLDEADQGAKRIGTARPVTAELKPETDIGNGPLPQPS